MEITNHLTIPSPLTKVETVWTINNNVELYIKRDDLIHPILSGNKWRKLSGILNHHESTYDTITTYGGAYSNHLVATAVACSLLKTPCKGIVRGDSSTSLNPVLNLCTKYGMRLAFVTRQQYKTVCRNYGVVKRELFIPEGGVCEEGTIGCANIITEMKQVSIDQLFVACGTGTTLAGLAKGVNKMESNISLNGIQVLRGDNYIIQEVERQFNLTNFTIYDTYHFGGYAKLNAQLIEFIQQFVEQTGILLDPVYTGKMMYAIKDLVETKRIQSGQRVVAIHTGGLTGWLGRMKEFKTLKLKNPVLDTRFKEFITN